jgi:Dimerisation domain
MHTTRADFTSMPDGRDHRAYPLPYIEENETTTNTSRNEPTGISVEDIMQFGLGFWGSKALLSAVELDLFTELASAPLDGETLRERLQLHPRGAREFFDAAGLLMSLNMLVRTQAGFDYTGADCIGWMHAAGFAEVRRTHLSGPHSMVVGGQVAAVTLDDPDRQSRACASCLSQVGVVGTHA